jgi:hypothetical protein
MATNEHGEEIYPAPAAAGRSLPPPLWPNFPPTPCAPGRPQQPILISRVLRQVDWRHGVVVEAGPGVALTTDSGASRAGCFAFEMNPTFVAHLRNDS